MNRSKSILFGVLAFLAISTSTFAQKFNGLDVSPLDAAYYPRDHNDTAKQVKIYYSRPQLKGRELATLAKNGEVWRTGANESAEIIFYEDMKMGDKMIKAGTYSLYTIPGDNEWTIIVNSDLNTWGAYNYKDGNDVARVTVPVTEGKESLEAFSITFDDEGTMHMGWGTKRVAVPFSK